MEKLQVIHIKYYRYFLFAGKILFETTTYSHITTY